jgi:hypothetical protein
MYPSLVPTSEQLSAAFGGLYTNADPYTQQRISDATTHLITQRVSKSVLDIIPSPLHPNIEDALRAGTPAHIKKILYPFLPNIEFLIRTEKQKELVELARFSAHT